MALVGIGTLLLQLFLPWVSFEIGQTSPEVQHLWLPYAVASVITVLCAQLILISVWVLVSRFADGKLFTDQSLSWINTIRWAVLGFAAIPALVTGHLLFIVKLGGLDLILFLFADLSLGAAAFLLLTVLRQVFCTAKAEHAELAEVI